MKAEVFEGGRVLMRGPAGAMLITVAEARDLAGELMAACDGIEKQTAGKNMPKKIYYYQGKKLADMRVEELREACIAMGMILNSNPLKGEYDG